MQPDIPSNELSEPLADVQAVPSRPVLLVTPALVMVNVLVFGATVLLGGWEALFSPSVDSLLKLGANFGPLTAGGEYWRVISSMFVHIGLLHIAMNMWVLFNVGQTVELLFGSWRFSIIYLLSGVAGSLNSLFWSPMNISAGASGAIFGAFGALLLFFVAHRRYFPPQMVKAHSQQVLFLILFNLVYGFSTPGIDNSAHLGGLIGGFLSGWCLMPKLPGSYRFRFIDWVWVLMLAGVLVGWGIIDKQRLEHNPLVKAYQARLMLPSR